MIHILSVTVVQLVFARSIIATINGMYFDSVLYILALLFNWYREGCKVYFTRQVIANLNVRRQLNIGQIVDVVAVILIIMLIVTSWTVGISVN